MLYKRNLTTVNNVADLPGMSDQEFLSWLEGQLLGERGSLPRQAAEASGPDQDSIVDIFWCYCEQLSKPGYLFPCCAILTRDKVVIERLASSAEILTDQSTSGLKPCTIVPICNIQQIVLGPCHAFLRLEEAFVGKPGTYTLFGLEPQGLKKFVIKLHKVCEILDVSNAPDFVDMSVQSDLLKEIITWEEQNLSLASDRLALVILVKELGAQEFSFLVLSENQVYCLSTSFVHWPPASFETSPDRSLAFNILHNFSITNKISNIKTHPLPSSDAATQSVPQPEVSGAIQFFMYRLDIGVSPSSDLSSVADKNVSLPQVGQLCGFAKSDPNQQLKESSNISYLFFSAAHRDLFLDRLSNLRAEQAHRLVSNVREEPEGGNELLPQTCRTGNQPACSTDLSQNLNTVQDQKNLFEEDAASTGSSQSGASEDNTIYYSASPSENLSVSPMSNFSRASISPPSAANQQVSGKQNVTSHLVRVEPTPGTGQPQEVHFPYNKLDQVISQKSSIVLKSYDADPEVNIRLKRANANSNSIPANLSGHAQQDFNIAFEHLKRPVGESTNVREESELDQHLRRCIRSYNLPIPLPVKLKPLYLMGGKELREFFKIIVSEIPETSVDARGDVRAYYKGGENQGAVEKKIEELRHVLWTSVVPYTNPKQEIVSLVMISTGGIYLVSDTSPSPSHKSRPSWMMHTRNQSDSVFAWKSSSKASVPANITQMFSPPRMSTEFTSNMGDSGAAAAVPSINKKSVKSFFRFRYEDLHQIDVGVFDQCVRLTGSCADSVFTLAVRDSAATEQLVQYLKDMLTLFYCSASSPAGDIDDDYLLSSWEADDFYRDDSHRTKSTLEGIVYTHPSQVKFVYPGEDAIKDILYLVDQSSKRPGKPQRKPSSAGVTAPSSAHTKSDSSLWLFILCHQLLGQPQEDQMPASQARSVIITPSHFSLSQQDIVTYPLPDFVRGLPEHPCHQIAECRPIEALKRIRMYRCNPHWLALTFVDEAEDFVVDTSIEHFSPAVSNKERQGLSPEVTFYLFIESPQEKDKLVKLLGKIWKQLVTQVGRILDVAHI